MICFTSSRACRIRSKSVARSPKTQRRQAALLLAEQFARPAQFQIGFRDLETIVGLRQNFQAPDRIRSFRVRNQDAKTFMRAAPDAPAQLMKLGQPERLRIFDEHHRRVRHVHADLNQRGREQTWFLVARNSAIALSFSAPFTVRAANRP